MEQQETRTVGPDPRPSDLDAEMARELLGHYLESAEEKLRGLDGALDAARAQPGDDGVLDSLRRTLHKLAGSAGSYGFPALSRAARTLEQAAILARKEPPAAAPLLDAVAEFRREMAAEFARARETLGPATLAPAALSPATLAPGTSAVPDAPAAASSPSLAQAALARATVAVAAAVAAAVVGAPPEPDAPAAAPPSPQLSAVRERLVIAVLCDEESDAALCEAAGAALAAAGTHLAGTGRDVAARGFRDADGEGLVLWIAGAPRSAASRYIDLPLCAPGLEAQCALLSAAADAALIIGGGSEVLAQAGCLLRDGKPVVALAGSGGAAAVLAGHALGGTRVFSAAHVEDAVGELLMLLAATSTQR